MNGELWDVQAGFRKGRKTRNQIASICRIIEKVRVSEKRLFLLYWLFQSLWLYGSKQTVENSSSQASAIREPWNFRCSTGFRKGRGTRDKIPTSAGSWKKQESSRKTSISALLTMPKPLTLWITMNCGQFWKWWKYQTTWPASWETCMQVRKQQLELVMEQQTGFKYEKEYIKAVYCHPAYLTSMQSTSWEMLD